MKTKKTHYLISGKVFSKGLQVHSLPKQEIKCRHFSLKDATEIFMRRSVVEINFKVRKSKNGMAVTFEVHRLSDFVNHEDFRSLDLNICKVSKNRGYANGDR